MGSMKVVNNPLTLFIRPYWGLTCIYTSEEKIDFTADFYPAGTLRWRLSLLPERPVIPASPLCIEACKAEYEGLILDLIRR